MQGQYSIFDYLLPKENVPTVNIRGYISADLLIPSRWEAWKFSRKDATLLGGKPYVIDAVLAVLPGNRLYVKEWMLYPFMHELKSAEKVEKMYQEIRAKIVDRIARNNEIQNTWQVNELPPLEDMWQFKDGEYSCKEYASKMMYGYKVNIKEED